MARAWQYECPKGYLHRWEKGDEGRATCLNCGLKLTLEETLDCFRGLESVLLEGPHLRMKEPFVLDTRSHDIPKTIVGMIRALSLNCVALSLRVMGGPAMIKRAEGAARRKGVRILWVT